jgi:hypothetical protein
MSPRPSNYRFWLLLATLAIGVLVACSSGDNTPGSPDGATGDAPVSMTGG